MKNKKTQVMRVEPISTNDRFERGWMRKLPAILLPSETYPQCLSYTPLRRYILPSGRFIDVFDYYKLDCEIDWTGEEDPAPGKLIFLKTKGGSFCAKPAIVDDLCAVCAGLEPDPHPDQPILTIEMLEAEMDRREINRPRPWEILQKQTN